jgi:hypothetical protein
MVDSSRQAGAEQIEVSNEMAAAGAEELWRWNGEGNSAEEVATWVYLAMERARVRSLVDRR